MGGRGELSYGLGCHMDWVDWIFVAQDWLTILGYPSSRDHLHFVARKPLGNGKQLQLVLSTTDILVAIRCNLHKHTQVP